ncbi:MAG: Lon protease family protein, partial [Candidatus Bipolaricaulota bacterium]
DRALDAIRLGLGVKDDQNRYNIYVAGQPGTGKMSAVDHFLKRVSIEEDPPPDLCYVHNFDNPYCPKYLKFPAGTGKKFREDMDNLIDRLGEGVSDTFESGEYKQRKKQIDQRFNGQKKQLFEELEREAEERNFLLQRTPYGINTVPRDEDGEPMDQEDFDSLSEEQREMIQAKQEELQSHVKEIMQQVMELEEERKEAIQELNKEAISFFLGPLMRKLRKKYEGNSKAVKYLQDVESDILENIDSFTNDSGGQNVPPWLANFANGQDRFKQYRVNLLVDNSETEGAPVVTQENATYPNLFGAVEKRAQFGTMSTDFTMIRPGALHQANGGYLVLKASNLFRYAMSWEGLKVALNCSEVRIEDPAQMLGYASTKGLEPEPMPLNVKVILIGNRRIYHILNQYEEDFRKLFTVKSDFGPEMDRMEEYETKIAGFIRSQADENGSIKHFHRSGVAQVVDYASEMVSDKEKLSTKFSEIAGIIKEASYWATEAESELVTEQHVQDAVQGRIERKSLIRDKVQELIERDKILADLEGQKVGQISGLSVLDSGDFAFGRPSRITANVYAGKEGVVNIDREADLSGSSHTKGVMILKGFLGEKFAYDKPLSLTANLTFEQTYAKVDGDSASSTELYAILSSLSGIPIKQGIAVTGSVNQKGDIQPIGGVNEKIKGFFEVCKQKGLTGEQGVVIPERNVDNLMLPDEVIQAVDEGSFHIYPVQTISEGVEILTGVPAGELDTEGYGEETVFGKADKRLREIREALKGEEDENEE